MYAVGIITEQAATLGNNVGGQNVRELFEEVAMQAIAIDQAERHLSEIIGKLAPGEEVVLRRDDKPVATLRATPEKQRFVAQLGAMKGSVVYIAPDFDDIPDAFEEYLP